MEDIKYYVHKPFSPGGIHYTCTLYIISPGWKSLYHETCFNHERIIKTFKI